MENRIQDNKTGGGLEKGVNRRVFVRGVGIAGVGVAGAAFLAGKLGVLDSIPGINKVALGSAAVNAGAITDVDILNFALNLEYLEAEFYTVATTGKTLEQSGIPVTGAGNPGKTTGGRLVNLSNSSNKTEVTGNLKAVVEDIAGDEQQHVMLLRTALGSAAIAKPAINLDALGTGFEGFLHFIALARAFEDVGVSAYGGAAPLITSKDILATAARIALTEANHAGSLRTLAAVNKDPFLFPVDSKDLLPPPAGKQYFVVDGQGLAIVRTPGQVLAIVYHNTTNGATAGGFFPKGVNGNITSVSV